MKSPLDLEVLWAAFLIAATAELGCLSRTAALVLRFDHPLSVCLGTLLGNIVILIPIFFLGNTIGRYLPETPVRIGTSLLFIAMGIYLILSPKAHL